MKNKIKRAVISVVVFAVIYILSGFIIGWHSYDMYLKADEKTGILLFVTADPIAPCTYNSS